LNGEATEAMRRTEAVWSDGISRWTWLRMCEKAFATKFGGFVRLLGESVQTRAEFKAGIRMRVVANGI
jgi:hypothetical protein